MTGTMTDILWLSSAVLAARRDEGEGGWLQLLVFLVMAVFYIISKIVKARSGNQEEEQEGELPIQLPPMRRRPIPQPKAPAGGKKIFSHKMAEPAVPEAVVIQSIEEAPAAKLAAMPEAAKHEIEIPPVELIALEKHDELAKGIIYSEILGKPLALRESWGYE